MSEKLRNIFNFAVLAAACAAVCPCFAASDKKGGEKLMEIPQAQKLSKEDRAATENLRNSILTIRGENGGGTGFFAQIDGKYFIVSNVHVMAGIKNPVAETIMGDRIPIEKIFCAEDRDIAICAVDKIPEGCNFLKMMGDASSVNTGDRMAVFGNSLDGGVILPSYGNVVGVGPKIIESSCAIYQGNSGSPYFHIPSQEVMGVCSFLKLVDTGNALVRRTIIKESTAVRTDIRFMGYRTDNIPAWKGALQADANRLVAEMEGYVKKIKFYNEVLDKFDKKVPNRTDVVLGDDTNPEFARLANKFIADAVNINSATSNSRLQNAQKEFYRNLDSMFTNERARLRNLKVYTYLEQDKKACIEYYDYILDICKKRGK